MATRNDSHSRQSLRLHLQGSFSSPEKKETFVKKFEAARLILAPGVSKRIERYY